MIAQDNDVLPYLADRMHYMAGMSVDEVRKLGDQCYREWYPGNFIPGMLSLVENLKRFGFEIWVLTASPEVLYEGFLSRMVGTPTERIIGAHAIVKDWTLTDRLVEPVPWPRERRKSWRRISRWRPSLLRGTAWAMWR